MVFLQFFGSPKITATKKSLWLAENIFFFNLTELPANRKIKRFAQLCSKQLPEEGWFPLPTLLPQQLLLEQSHTNIFFSCQLSLFHLCLSSQI